jgi:HlyD family secretion protein
VSKDIKKHRRSPFREVRPYLAFGTLVIAVLVGGMGVWAESVDLAGAVLASGHVVVDSSVKKVQHPTGGVVGEIRVKEGQRVAAGDVVMRLDETIMKANLAMVTKVLDENAVRQARLKAERDGDADITFPEALNARRDEPVLREIMASESKLFASRMKAREGLKAQLRERAVQLQEEVSGQGAQLKARRLEHEYAKAELAGLDELDSKSLVSTPRITAARRTVAQLEGDLAQVTAAIAQAKGKIAEIELQILQIDQELQTEVGKDLRDQQAREAELTERRVAAEDQLKRTEIRAPQSGAVHQLAIFTVGGVISPSETLMLIVPEADKLVIDAKVAPQDIDQIALGQTAFIRFSAFNHRTTPEVTATVTRISADLVAEPARGREGDGVAYYSLRLTMTDEARQKLAGLTLIPGMPVEVHIKTSDRTAISYFTKPLTDQFARAFRER